MEEITIPTSRAEILITLPEELKSIPELADKRENGEYVFASWE